MNYQDRVYGEIEISEAVVLNLINSPSIQRLKGVCQHGHFEPYFPNTTFSRFEHSVGVFLLLKKFGAPLKEQIAGLLHDVSHTVFSHVADYVFSDGSGAKQNFQDDELEGFIQRSEIPDILLKYGIDYKEILDDSKFPLKEKELPDLCADRIDYFLREILSTKKGDQKDINDFVSNFKIVDDFWVFKDKETAKKYAYLFVDINNFFWSGIETGVMFKTMGDLIKYAIGKKVIIRDDLFTTDKEVWEKIRNAGKEDKNLALLIDRADNKYVYIEGDKNNYDLYSPCKSRVVDPLFMEKGQLKRVSDIDEDFAEMKIKYSKPKEYYIKFLQKR